MHRHLLALSLSSLFAPLALGGSWSSGGGEILEHAQNPWFLDTPTSADVTYCVAAGSDFAVPLSNLETIVENAIRWWDLEFSNAYYPDNIVVLGDQQQNLRVFINTSRFVKQPCSDTTDLAFQFGTLTPSQTTEFNRLQVDLKRYVALTIRTDYSDALRGKGFIYVSPDRGPNAFSGQNVRPNAWTEHDSQFRTLQLVLQHELGHVFGLAHSSTNDSIMSARMAEIMVSTRYTDIYDLQNIALGAVFFPKAGNLLTTCEVTPETAKLRTFFEIPDHLGCVRVSLSLNALIVEAQPDLRTSSWQRIGAARFRDGGDRRHNNLVTLWLPQTQTIFPALPAYVASLLGPSSSEVQQTGDFVFTGSTRSKPIFIQASARFAQVGGMLEGQMVPDILPKSEYGRPLSGWGSE